MKYPEYARGQTWDVCVVCGKLITLTKERVTRVHGRANNRCKGSGEWGRYIQDEIDRVRGIRPTEGAEK